ncbi:hypothetical protein DVA67_014715 [Solirubrobacter sp. CPCC 204708]|uniref:Uncharacterized protein n=1 Tax=Solirubrobacter deserti TaxID=2282478 RepID=A0ABT4RBH9_9ACTN|nr:hypothetical protein [Solirubrobacter deserti]MBE2317231.1 hypothetical protein [Solirubrobacter deserti]MDA0135877.1 hypothetical protein [Solirubrobacter deserti]
MSLAGAQNAVVGVVESRTAAAGALEYSVRVERALKGSPGERVTLRSAFTSCQVQLTVGARVGLLYDAGGEIFACSTSDPETLIAASELPAPSGTARLVAAVTGVRGTDTVQLGADGRVAGYGVAQGQVLAQSRCATDGVVQALRGADGRVRLARTSAGGFSGSTAVPVRDAVAVGCTGQGDRLWAVGRRDGEMVLLSVRHGRVRERMHRRADAAAIVGSRAYFAHGRLVRIVPLTGGRLRSARIRGEFTSISGYGHRVAGRLRDGRSAVLDVRSGKLVTGAGGRLTWLDDDRLLGADGVYDTRLRRLRAVSTRGALVGVDDGAAFFSDGDVLYRLAPGARRATRFAQLPGSVTSVVTAPRAFASRASWHSCEESAKQPLTT